MEIFEASLNTISPLMFQVSNRNRLHLLLTNSARNLKFDSITGSILTFGGASIPNLQNGLLKMVAPTTTTGSTVTVRLRSLCHCVTWQVE
jgi:hypothetical protein